MADTAASMIRELEKVKRALYVQVQLALIEEAEVIMKRSNDEFAPKDTGNLIAESGVSVVESGQSLDDLQVVLHYGGPRSDPYVLSTHETPSEHDPATWKGKEVQFQRGGPKYLEIPLLEAENGMAERVGSKVKLG